VPDHQGEGHFLQDEDFCTWLQELGQAGHEIVIHGYYHWRGEKADDSWVAKLTTDIYTESEGEFYDIDRETAAKLVSQAKHDFRLLGLSPDGFIAPAWLLSAEGEEALRDAGCEYTTRLRGVTDLRTGNRYDSQSLVWSVRNPWRRTISRIWNAMLFRFTRGNPLLRISIHPVDAGYSSIWTQVRQCVRAALRDRAPFTYERWIARERTFRVTSPR
jgi:predicted deacetylase